MIKFKFTDKEIEEPDRWISFYPKRESNGFRFTVSPYWYFEPRPMIITSVTSLLTIVAFFFTGFSLWSLLLIPCLFFSWGQLCIKLPYDSGKGNDSDYPEYGVLFYSVNGEIPNHIWIRMGEKSKTINMPWAKKWYRTSILLEDGSWEHEKRGSSKDFWSDEWKAKQYKESHIYNYKLKSGEVQKVETDIYVEEREWRSPWFMWLPLFRKINRTIDVHFKEEVGERRGSWKGGVTGCGYSMKKGETPSECLKRMENERVFR